MRWNCVGVGGTQGRMLEVAEVFPSVQRRLFPVLAEEPGPLSALYRQCCEVMARSDLGRFTRPVVWCGHGAPPHARVWLMHAFIAKSVYQFPTTAALLDGLRSRPMLRQLCGWESASELPSEPTFSRAFAAFAEGERPQRIHAQMVQRHAGPKLVGPLSRDATAIEAPARPAAQRRDAPAAAAEAPGTARAAHPRGKSGRPAARLRRGHQVQQQGLQNQLDR